MKRCLTLLPLLALVALASTSCIRSRVQITSEPSGAEVFWRGEPYGATPITIPFIWYWYYDVALEKPGYQRVETLERFRTPPWFLLPLDFFMEVIPIPFYDTRERHYVLEPDVSPAEAVPVRELSPELTPGLVLPIDE